VPPALDATQRKLLFDSSATAGDFVEVAGDTMTGPLINTATGAGLVVSPTTGSAAIVLNGTSSGPGQSKGLQGQTNGSPRWNLFLGSTAAEGGTNTGSDFVIENFNDAGVRLNTPLMINRATSALSINGNGGSAYAGASVVGNASLVLNKPVGAFNNVIIGATNSQTRWSVVLGTNAAETGVGNTGSDFTINCSADDGSYLSTPLSITRATGQLNGMTAVFSGNISSVGINGTWGGFTGNFQVGNLISAGSVISNTVAGTSTYFVGQTAGVSHWALRLGDGTAAADLSLDAFDNTGTVIASSPLKIQRASGVATFEKILRANAYQCKAGTAAAAYGANAFLIDWPSGLLWIDAVSVGIVANASDYRIKQDVAPLPSTWEAVKALNPIRYTLKDYTPPQSEEQRVAGEQPNQLFSADGVERWGFIAHELQETLIPTAASGEKDQADCIQSPNWPTIVATLTKALQEAMARIEALEGAAA
jgi:hypothetical protein